MVRHQLFYNYSCNKQKMNQSFMSSHSDLICDSGYRKPTATSTLANKQEIVITVFLDQTVYSCLAELNQLRSGVNVFGVIDEVKVSRIFHFCKSHKTDSRLVFSTVNDKSYVRENVLGFVIMEGKYCAYMDLLHYN